VDAPLTRASGAGRTEAAVNGPSFVGTGIGCPIHIHLLAPCMTILYVCWERKEVMCSDRQYE